MLQSLRVPSPCLSKCILDLVALFSESFHDESRFSGPIQRVRCTISMIKCIPPFIAEFVMIRCYGGHT